MQTLTCEITRQGIARVEMARPRVFNAFDEVMIGQIDPDEGEIEMPRRTRIGYIAQEAPSGTAGATGRGG